MQAVLNNLINNHKSLFNDLYRQYFNNKLKEQILFYYSILPIEVIK